MSEFLFSKILSNACHFALDTLLDCFPLSMEFSWFGFRHKFQWSARTSGIVLIAGVGSYCAYRICSKYLGKEFVWTLMDVARLDRLSKADTRLLHPAAEGFLTSRQSTTFYEERARQRLCQLLRSLSEDDKAIAAGGLSVLGSSGHGSIISQADSRSPQKQRYRLLSTRSGSPIRVVCSTNPILRRALQKTPSERRPSDSDREGLAAIRWESGQREGRTLNTRTHIPRQNEDDHCDGLSDLTSVSRAQPPPVALLRTDCCTDVDGDPYEDDENMDNWSRSSYRHSTAGGDPLSWDDEFNKDAASVTNPLFRCASSSNISELSAMKNLEAMWANDEQKGMIGSSTTSLILRLNDDDTSSCCAYNLAELIESKCIIQSASYMYKSVHVDDTVASEVGSTLSATNQSVLSANFTETLRSHGLWEPSSRPNPEKENTTNQSLYADAPTSTSRLMSDSYISKSSSSSRSQKRSAMFDSGIGTTFISSDGDDDKSSLNGHTTNEPSEKHKNEEDPNLRTPIAKPIIKRSWLDKISEKSSPQHRPRRASIVSSVAPSEQSLEWFDELPTGQQQKIIIKFDEEEGTPI